MISPIAEYMKFVNLQMAAESFLDRIRKRDFGRDNPEVLAENLAGTFRQDGSIISGTGGNGRSSRFTRVAAEQFANDWEVLAHKDNAPSIAGGTGFSGTLFRAKHTDASKGITAGELVLSFRSTEFIDDYLRDNAGSNALELKDLGWTFGQIKEMEDWYKTLRQDQNLLGGKTFSVTGYSLGGELATAFNILRRDEEKDGVPNPVVFTMTFNGAGTGGLKEGNTLSGVMANFRNYLKAVASPDLAGLGFSGRLTDSLIELLKLGNQTNSAGWRDIKGALEDAKFSTDTSNRSLVLQAMKRVETLVAERNRVAGLKGIVLADGVTSPTPGDQFDLGYQVAALLAARGTIPSSVPTNPIANQVNFIPYERKLITPDNLLIQNMAEVYGSDGGNGGASFVSFSGLHYGKYPVPVYIEDQPLFRGNILSTFANLNVPLYPALLVDDPASNDFGDTHSLALLVDSLSTMQAMSSLDPNLTAGQIEAFFKTMSNSRKANFPKTQGRSEGDTLEFMLNAMGDLFGLRAGDIGPDGKYASGWQEMKPSNAGNTWFELGNYLRDGVGYTGRELFHRNLQLVNNAVQQTSTGPGIQPFSVQSLVELGTAAMQGLAGLNDDRRNTRRDHRRGDLMIGIRQAFLAAKSIASTQFGRTARKKGSRLEATDITRFMKAQPIRKKRQANSKSRMVKNFILTLFALSASYSCSGLLASEPMGKQLERALKKIEEQCRAAGAPPFGPNKPGTFETACLMFTLKPWEPGDTPESAFAHSIKLPVPHDKPKNIYKQGMSSEDYFKALCKEEAGEWVFRSVSGVRGILKQRPTPTIKLGYSPLVYYVLEKGEHNDRAPQDKLVQPNLGHFECLEEPI